MIVAISIIANINKESIPLWEGIKMGRSKSLSCVLAVVTMLSFSDLVRASGFEIYDHGAKEQAQGNAVVTMVFCCRVLLLLAGRSSWLGEVPSSYRSSGLTAT